MANNCREIITKAICGKGRKFSTSSHTIIPPNVPSNILGCWVTNNTYEAEKVGDIIEVLGSYDVDIWYSFNQNGKTGTDVAKERVSYVDHIPLSYLDGNCTKEVEVKAYATQQPNCIEATIKNGKVVVNVEKEFAVDLIGETKICVVVCGICDDDEKLMLTDDDFEQDDETININDLVDDEDN